MNLELRIPPVVILFVCAICLLLFSWLLPSFHLLFPYQTFVASVVFLLGLVVVVAGVHAFSRHQTTVSPMSPQSSSSLVTTGIYAQTRNPMYLGFLFLLIGLSLYLGSLPAILLLPTFVFYINKFQIEPEERALSLKFHKEFLNYKNVVRRWL